MEGIMEGWIKLYRILKEKPIWKKSTPEQKVILVTLLLMANHKESEWEWNGQKFKVKPGEMVTSIDSIKQECGKGISNQNVRTALVKFEKYGFLTNKSTKTGRLISIVNWEVYQGEEEKNNKDNNKDLTKMSQRPNKEVTPNKNDKNERNINSISKDILCSTDVQPIQLQPIIDKWNKLGLSQIKTINTNTNRYKLLKARIKEYGLDKVLEAMDNIEKSSFLKGQNSRGWIITFDWLLKPNNFIKVLEGNYTDKIDKKIITNNSKNFTHEHSRAELEEAIRKKILASYNQLM